MTASLILGSMLGAAAQTAAPGTLLSDEGMRGGEIRPTLDSHYMAWDGRALGLLNVGVRGGITDALAAGATYRGTAGHGRTSTNRYDGQGWQAWGSMRLVKQTEKRPEVSLYAEHLEDAVRLRSSTSTSSFNADPTCASSGGELRTHGRTWQARAGIYRTEVNGVPMATVSLIGGGLRIPMGERLTLQPSLTAYHDDLAGGNRYNGELSLALRGSPMKNADITLAGSLFLRGIPLAGSPMSMPSAIGVNYGSNATAELHDRVAGYISLSANYRF